MGKIFETRRHATVLFHAMKKRPDKRARVCSGYKKVRGFKMLTSHFEVYLYFNLF